MKKASLISEIVLETQNSVGVAKKLIHLITEDAHSHIQTFWGGVLGNKGEFAFITDDNKKVLQVLKSSEFNNVHEEEVLLVDLTSSKYSVDDIVDKIADAGININQFYTTEYGKKPVVVISTENNKQALGLLA